MLISGKGKNIYKVQIWYARLYSDEGCALEPGERVQLRGRSSRQLGNNIQEQLCGNSKESRCHSIRTEVGQKLGHVHSILVSYKSRGKAI